MSRLTKKYQVTLPGPVRKALKVTAGDEVNFLVLPQGHVEVVQKRATSPFDQYIGFLQGASGKNSDKIVARLRGRFSW